MEGGFLKEGTETADLPVQGNEAKRLSIILKAKEKQQLEDQLRQGLPSFVHVSAPSHDESFVPERPPIAPQRKVSCSTAPPSSSAPHDFFFQAVGVQKSSFLTDDMQGKVSVVQILGDAA